MKAVDCGRTRSKPRRPRPRGAARLRAQDEVEPESLAHNPSPAGRRLDPELGDEVAIDPQHDPSPGGWQSPSTPSATPPRGVGSHHRPRARPLHEGLAVTIDPERDPSSRACTGCPTPLAALQEESQWASNASSPHLDRVAGWTPPPCAGPWPMILTHRATHPSTRAGLVFSKIRLARPSVAVITSRGARGPGHADPVTHR